MESKINFTPIGDYVVCEWYVANKVTDSGIELVGESIKKQEEGMNGINEILAVGPEVKGILPGDWAMVAHMEVPIVNIDGTPCAMYKSHMIMGVFDDKPDLEMSNNAKDAAILKTKKTEKRARDFAKKYGDR